MNRKSSSSTSPKKTFSFKFWARVAIVLVVGFIFMQKDINFQVNLQSPLAKKSLASTSIVEGKTPNAQKNKSSPLKKQVHLKSKAVPKTQLELKDVSHSKIKAFIQRFSGVATSEQNKFGIPASIIIANGMLQSAAGQSHIAQQANNYFHIPCDASWEGQMQDFDGVCYRRYENAWGGFRGYSRYLSQHYAHLKKYGTQDYVRWAKGLEKGGFGQQKQLSKRLTQIIKKYDLDTLDR